MQRPLLKRSPALHFRNKNLTRYYHARDPHWIHKICHYWEVATKHGQLVQLQVLPTAATSRWKLLSCTKTKQSLCNKLYIGEGYLLPTCAQKITFRCFNWMLQSSSGWKVKKVRTNAAIYSQITFSSFMQQPTEKPLKVSREAWFPVIILHIEDCVGVVVVRLS